MLHGQSQEARPDRGKPRAELPNVSGSSEGASVSSRTALRKLPPHLPSLESDRPRLRGLRMGGETKIAPLRDSGRRLMTMPQRIQGMPAAEIHDQHEVTPERRSLAPESPATSLSPRDPLG